MAEINGLIISKNIKADYVGDVKDGKPDGVGKAYYQSAKMYEGEWKDGKQHGKGKEFYPDGTLQFEGEYKGGYRDGFGKAYNNNGTVNFEGEWKAGEPVGPPSTRTNWA
jgi:antitoxin component YwqK of YwqJK toxin-antitoxin module